MEGEIYRSTGAAISGGGEASAEVVGSVGGGADEGAVNGGIESCAIVIECDDQPGCSQCGVYSQRVDCGTIVGELLKIESVGYGNWVGSIGRDREG